MERREMAALKRASDRRANSFFIVIIFFGIFVTMLVTEVFYVEQERRREEGLLSMFSSSGRHVEIADPRETDLSPRVARELARVLPDNEEDHLMFSNETRFLASSLLFAEEAYGRDSWQRVPNTKDKFFVFSAYYDDRRSKTIRVIAAARTRLADKVVCRFWFADGRDSVNVFGTNRLIRENWNLKYSAYFILCPLKQAKLPIPTEVSIVKYGDRSVPNKLVVHVNREIYKTAEGIAVCVKPLHYEYNKVENLIEFIELNRLLGVNHFVLYNHTVGTEVGCVLRRYMLDGIVSVLPWQLDIASQKEIRTEGLFAALNDCLYRTMYRFRFVLMIDLDEFIVPYKNSTLTAMLQTLMQKNPERTGAYSFQNAFFYLQWPNDSASAELPYKLVTLQKTIRKSKFHAHKQRSKCIVLPERIVEMGNHFVWEFVAGKTMFNIPPDIGFLHHYRVCEFGGNDCINTTHVVDRRAYTWRNALLEAVALRLRLLQPVCQNVLRFLTG